MKGFKRRIVLLSAVSMLSIGSVATVMAANYQTPADAAADVTGRDVEDVVQERFETGKTFGAIAAEAGKLEEFKKKVLDAKEKLLKEQVEDGAITQEQADDILEAVKERQAACDGTGYGMGCGRGCGFGYGAGYGRGQGAGWGRRNGSCIYFRGQ